MSRAPVTINQAIRRAIWTIQVPSMALLIVPLVGLALAMNWGWLPSVGIPGLLWFGPTLFLSFVGGWLVWSLQVPKWRLWAYARVDNIPKLIDAAIAAQLIWPDSSIFTRTEIASRATWARIRTLRVENLR